MISRGTNMDTEQQQFAIAVCTTAFRQDKANLSSMAKFIKAGFESQFDPSFHVVVAYSSYIPAGMKQQ